VEQCRRYVLAGAKAERLAIFFTEISTATSPQNVHTAIAAIRHFGRLPIEDRSLESFRPPETEPFESFMARYRTT
jgi:hypothetical protein